MVFNPLIFSSIIFNSLLLQSDIILDLHFRFYIFSDRPYKIKIYKIIYIKI